jgi:hypothetical protein
MPTEALLPHASQQHSFLGITTIWHIVNYDNNQGVKDKMLQRNIVTITVTSIQSCYVLMDALIEDHNNLWAGKYTNIPVSI